MSSAPSTAQGIQENPRYVPVLLGCCPEEPRCLLCPPNRHDSSPELITALIETYEDSARPLVVSFVGGPPPSDAQVAAVGGLPFQIRVRPDLLSRARAHELVEAGCIGVELDALTFDDLALRTLGRTYRSATLLEMLEGLRSLGVEVGCILAPGAPGTTPGTTLRDASVVAEHAHTTRLHPVLVLRDTRLYDLHANGTYQPMTIDEVVDLAVPLMDRLEAAGVKVTRVGTQPANDGLGRATAGPRHSSLRELVECRRTLESLRVLFAEKTPFALGADHGSWRVACSPADISRVIGPGGENKRRLAAEFGITELTVQPDESLPRGAYTVERAP